MLVAAAIGTALIGAAAVLSPPPHIVYNGSRSVPTGWYVVAHSSAYRLGDLVLAEPPDAFARLITRRGYLPTDVPLIKRVAALPGDRVCYHEGVLTVTLAVADRPYVTVRPLPADGSGRVMPHWMGCRALGPDEVFLLLNDTDASLDSRYFGPVPLSAVRGKLRPMGWR